MLQENDSSEPDILKLSSLGTFQISHLIYGESLEEETATHCSIFAWRVPWTEEPGGLQSMGSQRVGRDCSDLAQH